MLPGRALIHAPVRGPVSAGSFGSPGAITGLQSVMQDKATRSNRLSDATRKGRFCFLTEMPAGWLSFCIPLACGHTLTVSVNIVGGGGGHCWIRVYKTSLLMESEGLFSSTLTPFSPAR